MQENTPTLHTDRLILRRFALHDDKALFALVVSGYSGSDLVARQLISAMNMNKSFYLPGRFALLETANDPGEAMGLPGVRDRLDRFADHMLEVLARRA